MKKGLGTCNHLPERPTWGVTESPQLISPIIPGLSGALNRSTGCKSWKLSSQSLVPKNPTQSVSDSIRDPRSPFA
jgi:hypothetical protein